MYFELFLYSFIKYPLIGALQFKYYDIIKSKNIYIFSKNLKEDGADIFGNYLQDLKNMCKNERNHDFNDDINYIFKGIYKQSLIEKSNDINLDDLIIRFIEVIPLQIAKIKNYFFKAMSNGKEIKKDELYMKCLENKKNKDNNIENDEIRITINELAEFINFGMIYPILKYYDLPVVVSSFMSSQSIGKSKLSNELFESFFNVSGMRCTEGIWMAISLFKGKDSKEKCSEKCKCCYLNNCDLYKHNKTDIKCLCEECRCNDNCCLFYGEANAKPYKKCKVKCALPLGHDNHYKDCKLYLSAKCEKHSDMNICDCERYKKNKSKYICEISPYNHGLISVSLDFEGLGTFERSLE